MDKSSEIRYAVAPMKEEANKALDPTAVSVSVFMRFDFTESFSYRDRGVPAVGQLFRSA